VVAPGGLLILDFGNLGIQPLRYPATIAPWVVYSWVALGCGVLGYFLLSDRRRINDTRLLFTADPAH
jgi:hypothetical protein